MTIFIKKSDIDMVLYRYKGTADLSIMVHENIVVDPDIGFVFFDHRLATNGNIHIGKGTNVCVNDILYANGGIFSESEIHCKSKIISKEFIEAHTIVAQGGIHCEKGNITATSHIISGKNIYARSYIASDENIEAKGKIWAGEFVNTKSLIQCDLGIRSKVIYTNTIKSPFILGELVKT